MVFLQPIVLLHHHHHHYDYVRGHDYAHGHDCARGHGHGHHHNQSNCKDLCQHLHYNLFLLCDHIY